MLTIYDHFVDDKYCCYGHAEEFLLMNMEIGFHLWFFLLNFFMDLFCG